MIVYVFMSEYEPIPSSATPTATMIETGCARRSVAIGTRGRRSVAATARNTGVSVTVMRRYRETSSSGIAVRNGSRHAHSLICSLVSARVSQMKAGATRARSR